MDHIVRAQCTDGHRARDLAIGDVIVERYRVERVLGRGSASVVAAAVDLTTGQHVAVKVLRMADPVSAERLLREARTITSLASKYCATRRFEVSYSFAVRREEVVVSAKDSLDHNVGGA